MSSITVTAHANIALIKYWGKRDQDLHLPTKTSLSVGLDALKTTTTIAISQDENDHITLNGAPAQPKTAQPIKDFLALFKKMYGITTPLAISTINNFPTAAGLASSASGFAALTLGLDRFFNLNLTPRQQSHLARRGSGSACRSLYGGFVVWHQGHQPDGTDSYAEQRYPATHWPTLRIIIVVVSATEKKVSSRIAMQCSVTTSPFYHQWIEESEQRLDLMYKALATKDFCLLGHLAEEDCLGMHKTMHTSIPAINFWSPTTYELINLVNNLRTQHNITCYFTIDAGANVKILCQAHHEPTICNHLQKITGVLSYITSTIAHDPMVTP